ncbi:MAG: glycosyltransferase family 2 protein [Rikenellaceae bacterium]|nr:glycosyltransferase family 2 protein [Rikenellaceae bacterium]
MGRHKRNAGSCQTIMGKSRMTNNGVMPPKVTVMIPCYNQENFIAQAIESVLMQDYENLEVVVADDCSTDQTGEIAQRYRSDLRYRYIRNAINRGRVENIAIHLRIIHTESGS